MKRIMVITLLIVLSVGAFATEYPIDWTPSAKTVKILQKAGKDAGLPIGLAECVAYSESRFISGSISPSNSRGLMQINARYEAHLADKFFRGGHKAFRWWVTADSASLGCNYLAYLIDYYGGSIYLGLISYNWGMSNLSNIKSWEDIPLTSINYANNILKHLDKYY